MPLDGSRFLTLSLLSRLLIELATAKFRQHTCLLAGTFEPTQGSVKIFVFFDTNAWHTSNCPTFRYKETRRRAGTELRMIAADLSFCKAKNAFSARILAGLRYDPPPMRILGLETSCDETGVALYDTGEGLIAEALHSQVDLHAVYGGVVPEIASRDHLRRLLPLIRQVLDDAGVERPDAIAYTAGPGLVGALMVGAGMANGLGLAWDCPVIPVHHMEGHLVAPMLEDEPPAFPFLA